MKTSDVHPIPNTQFLEFLYNQINPQVFQKMIWITSAIQNQKSFHA